MEAADEFYLQDSRSFVGNDMLFWAQDGKGYTTDLRKAHVYSREDAVRHHQARHTDIPWPKAYIDSKSRPAVDMQYTKLADALAGTGIAIEKPEPLRRDAYRCAGCNRFMSELQFWSGQCDHCGEDSTP